MTKAVGGLHVLDYIHADTEVKLDRLSLQRGFFHYIPSTLSCVATACVRPFPRLCWTAHTGASSRRSCTAGMEDHLTLCRHLVHPARRTSLFLCAGTSEDRQQLEVGAEMHGGAAWMVLKAALAY